MRRHSHLTLAAIICLMTAGCGTPTEPSPAATTILKSIKYVRVRPVTSSTSTPVVITYHIPIVGDPQQREKLGQMQLTTADQTTFVYDPIVLGEVPVDVEITLFVRDDAVAQTQIATDVYINEPKIRVQQVSSQETGLFKVTKA